MNLLNHGKFYYSCCQILRFWTRVCGFGGCYNRGVRLFIIEAALLRLEASPLCHRGGVSGLLKPIGLINMGPNPLGHVGQSF